MIEKIAGKAIFLFLIKSNIHPMTLPTAFVILVSDEVLRGDQMTGRWQILIVDDQQRSRQSLRALLATWPPAREIREAVNGQQTLKCIGEARPDIVLVDLHAPEMDGLSFVRQVKTCWPEIKVIVLSLYSDYATAALEAGVDAFISKGEPANRLLEVLEAVAADIEE